MQNQVDYCNSIANSAEHESEEQTVYGITFVNSYAKMCYDFTYYIGKSREEIVGNVFKKTKKLGNNGGGIKGKFINMYLTHIIGNCGLKVINDKEAQSPEDYCNFEYAYMHRIIIQLLALYILLHNVCTLLKEKDCLEVIDKLFKGCRTALDCLRFALRKLRKPVIVVEYSKAWDYLDYLILHIAPGLTETMKNQEDFCKTVANSIYEGSPKEFIDGNAKICHDAIQFLGESLEDIVENVFSRTKCMDAKVEVGTIVDAEEDNNKTFIDMYVLHIIETCGLKVVDNKEASHPDDYCNSTFGQN